MDLSIVIPSFNGGTLIKDLLRRMNETLSGKFTFEIIFVFDNGKKKTLQTLNELKHEYPVLIKVYRLALNYGQHRAIQFGLSKTNGNFIVTIDEDLQHDPADIHKLFKKQIEGNYDVVYGKFPNLQHIGIRNNLSIVLRKFLKHYIPNLYDNYSPYRLIKREIAYKIANIASPYTFIDDLLGRITNNFAFVDITHYRRFEGKSSYSLFNLARHGILIILSYSRIIRWLFAAGVILILAGFVLIILKNYSSLMNFIVNPSNCKIIFGVGLLLLIVSFIGIIMKSLSKNRNTKPVQILL